ncbi:MAG: SDR family NAD(P)-dependent oxidoreductase [Pseudodesulfovibrio sp.]|uniref:SDR family NAD(P)-dependent oxidoreductase n=1 Tax=Pseudodesulfovibrio sp. TaxID=2035812 RepID=UPI003D09DAD1
MSSISCNVAIVGIGVRLPGGVRNCDDFWNLLINGVDGVTEIPANRWCRDRFLHGLRSAPGRSITFSAGVVDDIDFFDCKFFGISEREAQSMDPQQRLALEIAWEMFENGNIKPSSIAGSNTGVFMGASSMDAALSASDDPWNLGPFSMTGNSLSIVSNRLSFVYDLHGPSLTLDTACSSSLVAVYEACKFLEQDGGDTAIAGGVNSLYSPFPYIGFSKAQMLAEHGRCKVFDQDGNGYVRSEGGVLYLLKRLDDAVRDGNVIHAVINASGSNSDGMTVPGMSFPNIEGQKKLLSEIYGEGKVDPDSVAYMEAHGTGTAAGDPTEVGSIGAVVGQKRAKPLLIGSAKSSVGHLEPASGVTGMLRSILIIKNKVVPPNIHLKKPLDTIDFKGLNIEPVVGATPLPDTGGPVLVGVNSFGFGGTNAHALLREFGPGESQSVLEGEACPPLFLSAKSEGSLRGLAGAYADAIEEGGDYAALAGGAVLARELMAHRLVAEGADGDAVAESLRKFAEGESDAEIVSGAAGSGSPKLAFAFSGNGAQWDGMGGAFYATNEIFRQTVDEMDAIISPLLGWSLAERMQREEGQEVNLTEVSQPMLLAYQIGMLKALESKGIVPDMVYGHSVGEVTAAYAAGALDLRQACEVIYHRSIVQAKSLGTGRMAVVKYSLEDALALPEVEGGEIEVAASNAPEFVTLSGSEKGLLAVQERIKREGGVFRMLKLDYPFHSRHMEPFKDDLLSRLDGLAPSKGTIPFISAHNGDVVDGDGLDAHYWWMNIRDRVHFHEATLHALDMGAGLFLEVGPNAVLGRFLTGTVKGAGRPAKVLPTMRANKDGDKHFNIVWKQAFVQGAPVDFTRHVSEGRTSVKLPLYNWDKVNVSLPPTIKSTGLLKRAMAHPLLGFRKDGDLYAWENTLDSVLVPILGDHVIYGDVILPGAAIIEMALAAATEVFDQAGQEVIDLALMRPLPVPVSPAMDVRCTVSPEDGTFRLESKPLLSEEQWTLNAAGRLALKVDVPQVLPPVDVTNPDSFGDKVDVGRLYAEAREAGLEFGPLFKPLKNAWIDDDRALAMLDGKPRIDHGGVVFDPCLLDGCFHTLLALIPSVAGGELHDAFLPAWFGRVSMYRPGAICYALATLTRLTDHSAMAEFKLLDEQGEVLGHLQECRFIRLRGRGEGLRGQRAFSVDLVPIEHPGRLSGLNFPSTEELFGEVEKDLDELAEQYRRLQYYEELRPLCKAAVLSHLYALLKGVLPPGFSFSIDDLRRFGVLDESLFHFVVYLLRFLENMGAACCKDGTWALSPDFELPDAETVWRSIVDDYPGYLPETVVLGRLGMHLVNLLRGRRNVEEILSYEPGGLLEAFYTRSPSARFQNTQVARLVERLRRRLPAGRPLRILDVGAGFGGPLQDILSSMPSEQLKYTCLDKSDDVLQRLKAANSDNQHVSFVEADIEIELPESLSPGDYDVVLVSHVLHELDDLGTALDNCRKLLAPNGMIIVVERNPDPLIDIFLGADPNWWKHSPSQNEPVSRLLPMDSWRELFERAGYADFRVVSEKNTDYPESYILLAKNAPDEREAGESQPVCDDKCLWVVVEDAVPSEAARAVRDGLLTRFEAADQEVVVLRGDLGEAGGEVFDLGDSEAWRMQLRPLRKGRRSLKVVNLAGMDTRICRSGEFKTRMTTRAMSVIMFGQACRDIKNVPELWVVCGGAMGCESRGLNAVPAQAAAWGAARVLVNEMPDMGLKLIDLHCDLPDDGILNDLAFELMEPAVAMEIVLTGKERLIPRLVPLDRLLFENDPHAHDISRISLMFDQPGKLDNLYWKQEMDLAPEAGQVLIKVRATGLNFRDVMFSMGMLPVEALEDGLSGPVLGLECSGEVMGVGAGVTEFQVGDEVMCMAGPCFDSHTCVDANYVFAKPDNLSFEEAATIPVAFSTAYYSLKLLGNVKEGDRVLIHSAAGGVGLAALQVANWLGAEVFATSGSEEKREFLKLLGVKHVMDSRSLDFYDKCRELTGGEGVDVVLNSLAGEALFKSLKLLKPFGRFLELGKRDFYGNTPLRMRMLRKNISFFGIDLDEYMACKPKEARAIFSELIALFKSGEFKPLVYSVFSRAGAVDAFKAMQRGKHIGKMVVSFDELNHGVRTLPKHRYKDSLDSSGSYLVSGGLGGLGLATAKRLVANGARNIILLSRSGAVSEAARAGVRELEAAGAVVATPKADVADMGSLKAAMDEVLKEMPPLKGVIHSAAVLRDSMVANITREQVEISLHAKAVGGWCLHEYTRDIDLDHFIMYSSATTVLGNPGQVNYVAANMVLEALAQHRRAIGLPAVTYGWGPISDTGMLTAAPEVMESLKRVMGVSELPSKQALDYMELSPDDSYANLFYFNLDWNRVRDLKFIGSTMFNWIEELKGGATQRTLCGDSAKSILALERDEAIAALVESIGIEVAAMLKIPFESMDTTLSIAELGLDSLMAVELGLLIEERYGVKVSSFSMNVSSDLTALSERIYEALLSGGAENRDEAEEVAAIMREKHGIAVSSETVSKTLDSVNSELEKTE